MIRIQLLGGFRISRDGTPLDSLLSQRLRAAIVVYLALERDVSREALLRLLWPDRDSDKARHALSQNLYELRRALGSDWLQISGERLALGADVVVDVGELEAAASASEARRGCELYAGPFLADVAIAENVEFEHWIDSRRAHYARLYRKLVRQAVTSAVEARDLEGAIHTALRATRVEPLEDEFHHLTIELLARVGKRADALRHLDLYERLLRENGLTALDETVSLVAKIRAGEELGVFETLPESNRGPAASNAAVVRPRVSHRRAAVILVSVIILAAAVPVLWSNRHGAGKPYRFDARLQPERVAILPLTSAPNNFRERLSDELARSPQIDVAPTTDVDEAVRTNATTVAIASATQSLLIVAGSFRKDSADLTLTLRILDGGTGERLAARQFSDPQPARLLNQATDFLSDEVVRTSSVLRYRREATEASAWRLFNTALERFRSAGELARAAHFEAALRAVAGADSLLVLAEKADPNWLAPTLMRAQVASRAAYFSSHPLSERTPAEAQQWFVAAVAQSDRALERRPGNADALELRGLARYELWRWRAGQQSVDDVNLRRSAQTDLEDAISADSRRARSWLALAGIADALADAAQQKRLARRAYEVDPTSARDRNLFFWLGRASLELGQDAEALRWCRMGLDHFPGHLPLLNCEADTYAFGNGLPADVTRMWRIVAEVRSPDQPPQPPSLAAMFELLTAAVIARAGLPDSARAVAARAVAAAPGNMSLIAPEALLRTRLGEVERALDLLESDAAQDPVWTLRLIKRPAFAPLRNQPRFQRLLARLQRADPSHSTMQDHEQFSK